MSVQAVCLSFLVFHNKLWTRLGRRRDSFSQFNELCKGFPYSIVTIIQITWSTASRIWLSRIGIWVHSPVNREIECLSPEGPLISPDSGSFRDRWTSVLAVVSSQVAPYLRLVTADLGAGISMGSGKLNVDSNLTIEYLPV